MKKVVREGGSIKRGLSLLVFLERVYGQMTPERRTTDTDLWELIVNTTWKSWLQCVPANVPF